MMLLLGVPMYDELGAPVRLELGVPVPQCGRVCQTSRMRCSTSLSCSWFPWARRPGTAAASRAGAASPCSGSCSSCAARRNRSRRLQHAVCGLVVFAVKHDGRGRSETNVGERIHHREGYAGEVHVRECAREVRGVHGQAAVNGRIATAATVGCRVLSSGYSSPQKECMPRQ